VPADARLAASIRLDAADLDAALEHLERLARREDHGLPIMVAFALSQLRLEISLLRAQLESAGFVPNEVVRLSSPDGTPVWMVPITCDLGEAKLRVGSAWNLDLRITSTGTLGEPRPPTNGQPAFPHAVLFLPGERMALVPASAASARTWLTDRQPAGETPATPPGERLDEVADAAVRMVFGGRAFLAGDGNGTMPEELRATGDGLEIDGSLWSPP
jgi:hypothetical protein